VDRLQNNGSVEGANPRRGRCLGASSVVGVPFLVLSVCVFGGTSVSGQIFRPGVDQGPTKVRTGVFLLDVDEVDNVNQSFDANLFIICRWHDPSLAHAEGGEISYPLKEVWHPRIQIVNQQKIWLTFPDLVEVAPDGEVTYRQRGWGSFSQPLNLRDFPFDTQRFTITLAAAGHSPEEVQLLPDPEFKSGIGENLSLPDWTVVSFSAKTTDYNPRGSLDGPVVAGFAISFEAERHQGYYWVKVIVPLTLVVAMSFIVFWIDPKESGTQIGVSVTTMLTLIAYRFAAGMTLPKVSYLTCLDHFILVSTILVFSALVEVVATSALTRRGKLPLARLIDRRARWAFPLVFIVASLESLVFRVWS